MLVTAPLQSTSPKTPAGVDVGVGVQGSGSVGIGRICVTLLFASSSSITWSVASTVALFSPLRKPLNHSDAFMPESRPAATVCWSPLTSTTNGPASIGPMFSMEMRMPSVVDVKSHAPPVSSVTDMLRTTRSGASSIGVPVGPAQLISTVLATSTVCASVSGLPSKSSRACPTDFAGTVWPPSASLSRKPVPSGCSAAS